MANSDIRSKLRPMKQRLQRKSPVPPPGPAIRKKQPNEPIPWFLDAPIADTTMVRGFNQISGWVFHANRQVRLIEIVVNGQVQSLAPPHARKTVAEAFPDTPYALMSGFSALCDLSHIDTPECTIVIRVVFEVDAKGVPVERITVARRKFKFAQGTPSSFIVPSEVVPGYIRVRGYALPQSGLSEVEIFRDGISVGHARITGTPEFLASPDPADALAGFEVALEIPDQDEITLSGIATAYDGSAHEIPSLSLTVVKPESDSDDDEARAAITRKRLEDLIVGLPTHSESGLSVLVLTHDLGLGGGQLYLQELLIRLRKRGAQLAVVSPRGGRLVDELEDLGIPVLITGQAPVQDPEAYETHLVAIMEWARGYGCQVALANTIVAFAGADAAKRLGLGLVWAIHESFPLKQIWMEAYPPPFPAYAAERTQQTLAITDKAVFEAEATRQMYEPWLPADSSVVVPYGVDFDAIARYRTEHDRSELRRELGFDDETTVLLCLGTIEPRKAQMNLAQAFCSSDVLTHEKVALVFVGARDKDPYCAALARMTASQPKGRVHIEPIQPDTFRWYHAADVLVCASDIESLPRSILEAMAFGCPIASTAVFGIPDLIADGDNGFLCEPRNQSALRTMLERVAATSTEALSTMGKNAEQLALTRHDPAIYEQYYWDELNRLVQAQP